MKTAVIFFVLIYSSLTHAICNDADKKQTSSLKDCSVSVEEGNEVANCNIQSVLHFAQQFYREHHRFYADPERQNIEQLFTAEFGNVILNHAECVGDNGICNLDFNPWLNAQDGFVDGEIEYSAQYIDGDALSVDLNYQFRVHSTLPAKPQTVSLSLHRTDAPDCWKVDDMILSDKTSMKEMMLNDYQHFYFYKKTKLSWQLLSSDIDSSEIAVHRDSQRISEFELNCDVKEALTSSPDDVEGEMNRVGLVATPSNPQGFVISSCRFGAHSKKLSVYDLKSGSQKPVWEKTGSYFAEWSVNDNYELVLSYDRPCDKADCSDSFIREDVVWGRQNIE